MMLQRPLLGQVNLGIVWGHCLGALFEALFGGIVREPTPKPYPLTDCHVFDAWRLKSQTSV
ncbi:MAG: hypothetical protein SFY66_02595 [Oculatellaceae cyanobacterium bins.114]|nr:hypothetical protein [Oculatellaceae cyanobacterium bins.114]